MSIEEIIEKAIQGHASTRDAIRWAIEQEREACAKVCDSWQDSFELDTRGWYASGGCAHEIRARGDASDISAERVDEIAKSEHEPDDLYDIWVEHKEKTND